MAKSKEASRRTYKNFIQQLTDEIPTWTTNWLNGNFTTTARAAPYFRPHSSLDGKTPIEFATEHSAKAPFWDEVEAAYDQTKERIREQSYWRDQRMKKVIKKSRT